MRTGDGHLIRECLNGKPAAFGFLVDRYKASVFAFVYAELGNFHDAEDVTQEIFIKAYQKLRALRVYDRFHAWLYSIASNICKNWIRTQSRRPDREFIEDQDSYTLEEPSIDPRRVDPALETLHEVLASLPKTYRQVLSLYYLGGMNSREIARFLGASPAAIRQRLVRARSRLQENMIDLMDTAFEQQRLKTSFTFRLVEAVKQTKIQPLPRATGLPWGFSAAAGIFAVALGFSSLPVSLSPSSNLRSAGMRSAGTDEISVDVLDARKVLGTVSRHRNDDSAFHSLAATYMASMADAERAWVNIGVMPTQWERHTDGPVLDIGPPGAWDDETVFGPTVIFDGTQYKMWYGGCGGSNDRYGGLTDRIGYATSDDGTVWEKYPDNPVLDVGEIGEWDDCSVGESFVLFDGTMYRMWYSGKHDLNWRIGYATSDDGIVWKKHPANPILDLGPPSTWDDWTVSCPTVIFDGIEYKMWYQAYDSARMRRIGCAISGNGILWEKHPSNPVLDLGPPGAWDSHMAGGPAVLFDGNIYRMWYAGCKLAADGTTRSEIGYAISRDGILWEKYPGNPVFDVPPSGTWERTVSGASILFDGTQYKMWYLGTDRSSMTKRIGYAASLPGASIRIPELSQERKWRNGR